jgi:hypothetical protein
MNFPQLKREELLVAGMTCTAGARSKAAKE